MRRDEGRACGKTVPNPHPALRATFSRREKGTSRLLRLQLDRRRHLHRPPCGQQAGKQARQHGQHEGDQQHAQVEVGELGVAGRLQAHRPQAEQRVRLGLIVAEMVDTNNLHAKPEQVDAYVQEIASSYEKPAEVVRFYMNDAERLAELRSAVTENNLTEFALAQMKKSEKTISFEDLMGQGAAA